MAAQIKCTCGEYNDNLFKTFICKSCGKNWIWWSDPRGDRYTYAETIWIQQNRSVE
jgi:adenine specific DNA methylase Mod